MAKMNELYEKVAKDEALQAEVAGIVKGATADKAVEIKEKLVAFAKRQGFDVSIDEIDAFFGGMAQASQELSETELDSVAGGKSDQGILTIVASGMTVGTLCALMSGVAEAVKSISKTNCKDQFQ